MRFHQSLYIILLTYSWRKGERADVDNYNWKYI